MPRRSGTSSSPGQISGNGRLLRSQHSSHASRLVPASLALPSHAAHCKGIKDGAHCRFGEWNLKDVDFLNQVQLITAKPVVYLVNLPEKMYIKKKSKWLPKVAGNLGRLSRGPVT